MFLLAAVSALALTVPLPMVLADDAAKTAVVHFSKLTPFLKDVTGWEADKAQGNTLDAGELKMTSAERHYTKGEASVDVSIVDYSQSKDSLAGMTALWNFSNESSEGYQKSVTIDGAKGWEGYENANKKGQLFLLVAGRYMVTFHLQGLPASETQAWAKNLDVKKLAEVK